MPIFPVKPGVTADALQSVASVENAVQKNLIRVASYADVKYDCAGNRVQALATQDAAGAPMPIPEKFSGWQPNSGPDALAPWFVALLCKPKPSPTDWRVVGINDKEYILTDMASIHREGKYVVFLQEGATRKALDLSNLPVVNPTKLALVPSPSEGPPWTQQELTAMAMAENAMNNGLAPVSHAGEVKLDCARRMVLITSYEQNGVTGALSGKWKVLHDVGDWFIKLLCATPDSASRALPIHPSKLAKPPVMSKNSIGLARVPGSSGSYGAVS
jgi:hypothetical protein